MNDARPRPNRFPASFRLGHRLEYQAVFAAKTRVERGPLLVHAIPNELGRMRLGLSIGRRVGPAVRRNRLKRLLRDAFRTARERMPGPYDVVVSARAHQEIPLDAYREHLLSALEQLHRTWTNRSEQRNRTNEPRREPGSASPPAP